MKKVSANYCLTIFSVFFVALIVRIACAAAIPLEQDSGSDAGLLVGLAKNISEGNGYQLSEGIFWTDQPTICRSPGWPVIMSVPFRILPDRWHWRTAQVVSICCDGMNAVLISILVLALGGSGAVALVGGILYAVNPVLAGIAITLCRDSIGFTFLLLFIITVRMIDKKGLSFIKIAVAGLLLGCACMIRTNWLIIAPVTALGFMWIGRRQITRTIIMLMLYTFCVCLPVAPWLIRNAIQFDRFPLFGAGGGETLWGGNNDLSAEVGGQCWGYFVFPNKIPGAPSMRSLAETMSELEVDAYYQEKGKKWLSNNRSKLPGLLLGKFLRAYIPIPRTRGVIVLAGSAYRWMIYLLAVLGGWIYWRKKSFVESPHLFITVIAVCIAQLFTVLMFCGYFRYVLASELLLVVPAGYAIKSLFPRRV